MKKVLFYSITVLCWMLPFYAKAVFVKDSLGSTKEINIQDDWTVRQFLHAYEKGRESKMGSILVLGKRINAPGDLDNNAKQVIKTGNTVDYINPRDSITFSMRVVEDILADNFDIFPLRSIKVGHTFPVIELYRSLENDVQKTGKIRIYPNGITIPNNGDDKKLISEVLPPNAYVLYITEQALRNAFTALYQSNNRPKQQAKIFQSIIAMGGNSHPWYDTAARMMGVVPIEHQIKTEAVFDGDPVEESAPPSQPQPVLHAVEKSPSLPKSVASNPSPVIQQMSPEELDSRFTEITKKMNQGDMDGARKSFDDVEKRGGKNHSWYKNILYTLYPDKRPTGYSNSANLQENPDSMPVQPNLNVNEKPQPMAVQPTLLTLQELEERYKIIQKKLLGNYPAAEKLWNEIKDKGASQDNRPLAVGVRNQMESTRNGWIQGNYRYVEKQINEVYANKMMPDRQKKILQDLKALGLSSHALYAPAYESVYGKKPD